MRNECFALRLCSLLKGLLGLEKIFILNYGNHFPWVQVCLLHSILRRALIGKAQGRTWIQRKGAGGSKRGGGRTWGVFRGVVLLLRPACRPHPQLLFPSFPPILSHPVSTPTFKLWYHGWWDKAFRFSFSRTPETSSCLWWRFSSSERSAMRLLALKNNLNFNWGAPGWAVSLTFESVNLIWSSSWKLRDLVELEPFRTHCRVISHFFSSITQQQKVHLEYKSFFN